MIKAVLDLLLWHKLSLMLLWLCSRNIDIWTNVRRPTLMSLAPLFKGSDVRSEIRRNITGILVHSSSIGRLFLPPPMTHTGTGSSWVEPRFAGSKSITLTTEPRLLLNVYIWTIRRKTVRQVTVAVCYLIQISTAKSVVLCNKDKKLSWCWQTHAMPSEVS